MSGTVGPRPESIFNRFSFEFDGTDDYVNCGNDSSLNPSSDISVSLWFKGSNVTKLQYLFSKLFYRLGLQPVLGGTQLIWEVYYTPSALTKITLNTNFADGNWHHILATYQSGATLGQKLYVDGNLLGQINAQSQIYTSGFPFLIGGFITTQLNAFEGNIDEVAIWDSDQSAAATDIYNGGKPKDLSGLSPVSWWRMGDKATYSNPGGVGNWTLTDQGSGGNDGTSNGMDENNRVLDTP